MKEAYGGIVSLVFISIFLVIVISVLGLVVSYTKAFKMKDRIISVIEEYEGSGCYPELSGGSSSTACKERITDAAKELGYSPSEIKCSGDLTRSDDNLYCYSMERLTGTNKAVFKVVTQVDISFPIIDKIMGFRFFQVSGDTEAIELQLE